MGHPGVRLEKERAGICPPFWWWMDRGLGVAGRAGGSGRRGALELEEVLDVEGSVAEDGAVGLTWLDGVAVVVALDVAVEVLERSRCVCAAGCGLEEAEGVDERVGVALTAVQLDVEGERAGQLRGCSAGADEESGATADPDEDGAARERCRRRRMRRRRRGSRPS